MPSLPRTVVLMAALSSSLITSTLLHAQNTSKSKEPASEPAKPKTPNEPIKGVINAPPKLEFKDEIKPLPPVAIPDNPPPHEGAFFDLPITIEPPDIIVVEVLEGLPGRPITGERLVRPDGTISLGFYGDLYVRGLTLEQAKIKIILHLRRYMNDHVLGLLEVKGEEQAEEPDPKNSIPTKRRNPSELDKMEKPPAPDSGEVPSPEKTPGPKAKPVDGKKGRPSVRNARESRLKRRIARQTSQDPPPISPDSDRRDFAQEKKGMPQAVPGQVEPAKELDHVDSQWIVVQPADSARIFVDMTSFNSKVYYVQGDVGVPGRLPWTGEETVLAALNFAGGLVPTAEPAEIHLYRAARGDQPAKNFKIDFKAIQQGVASANLQLFPKDRLIVGRNPIVAKTIEIDRAAGLVNSVMNSIMQYSYSARSLGNINSPPSGGADSVRVRVNGQNMPMNVAHPAIMTSAQRDAMIKEWAEFFWSITSKEGGAMLDEKAFRDALMKKLTPAQEPK